MKDKDHYDWRIMKYEGKIICYFKRISVYLTLRSVKKL
jgi:hypothetical protein